MDLMNHSFLRAADSAHSEHSWGALTWLASAALGNSSDMTVGRCLIKPGQENPPHSHPNCSEVLTLLQGRIAHTVEGGREVEMAPGDTITIPATLPHHARNIGPDDAVMIIAFSSAYREFQLENG